MPDQPSGVALPVPVQPLDARAGFAAVFDRHQASLLRVALLLSGDPHRAEEAVAEAFAKVWPHWRRGRVKDDAAYLRRAVVNEVHSSGRRLGRQDRAARRHTSSAAPEVPFDEDSVQRDVLLAALATLPKGQRAVIVLRFYDDMSEAATAATLGMRIGTVKSQTSRGLSRLRVLLSQEER